MNTEYDLTNMKGLDFAFISGTTSNPMLTLMLGKEVIKLIKKGIKLFDSKELCKTQSEAASELIKEGKKNGVKKMKITLDQEAGLNFEAPISGVNIRAMAGNKGKMTIEVEYE